jgi:hypothetical protein
MANNLGAPQLNPPLQLGGGQLNLQGGVGAPPLDAGAPQLPFGADPGSITGWMLSVSAIESTASIAAEMERGFLRLGSLPEPNAATYEAARQGLLGEVLDTDTLGTYLVVTNTPHDAPRVTVLHSLARYSAGFGGASALHGKILGLLGEMVEDQLPTMVQIIDDPAQDLLHGFLPEGVDVPPVAAVDAFFANPHALQVMPKVTAANGATATAVSCLCPIPVAWAPYFMDFKTPAQAHAMGKALVATMANAEERTKVDPLLDWFRAATLRAGNTVDTRKRSLLVHEFEATAPSARVITWMKNRLAQFRLPSIMPHAGGGYAPNHAGPPAAALPPTLGDRPEKEYTQLEATQIQMACGLTFEQVDAETPVLYSRMLEEGRKTAKVRMLLVDLLRPVSMDVLTTVIVTVTDEMAKDIKELNFGFGNDLTYDSCHRGISPFTVVNISMATASTRRRKADRLKRATYLSVADLTETDTIPDPLPTTYLGLKDLLNRYLLFLDVTTGRLNSHRVQVRQIAVELAVNAQAFENIGARQIASLVWQIFLDARRFFSEGILSDGTIPFARLGHQLDQVMVGLLAEQSNVPYGDLVAAPTPAWGGGEPGRGGGGRAGATGERGGSTKIFGKVPTAIAAALAGATSKYPNLKMTDVLVATSPATAYTSVKLGPAGSCLDFLALGRCKTAGCSYAHNVQTHVAAEQVSRAAPKLKTAFQAYDARQGAGT